MLWEWSVLPKNTTQLLLGLNPESSTLTIRPPHLPQSGKYFFLYHAIENTANQNTGKTLYIRRYSTQPSHHALRILDKI